MFDPRDIQEMLDMGFSFNNVDFEPDPVRDNPQSRRDSYAAYIDKIEPLFSEFADWGGDTLPREMAMKLYPYEDWPY